MQVIEESQRWRRYLSAHGDALAACGLPIAMLSDVRRWNYLLMHGDCFGDSETIEFWWQMLPEDQLRRLVTLLASSPYAGSDLQRMIELRLGIRDRL